MSAARFEPPTFQATPWADVPHRTARRVPHRSVEGVLARVLRDAMTDDWNPVVGAHRAVLHVQGDEELLRRAHRRLVDTPGDRVPLVRARAVASLKLAIGSLEDPPDT
jgi:hypothetical protein